MSQEMVTGQSALAEVEASVPHLHPPASSAGIHQVSWPEQSASAAITATAAATTAYRPGLAGKLVNGAVAGIIGTSCIYPLDMVKTHLQSSKVKVGALQTARNIYASGGMRQFYSGLRPNLIGVTPEKAIKLGVNDYVRERLAIRAGLASADQLSVIDGMVAGATAGTCQVIATNPMEIVKIHMQMAASSGNAQLTASQVVRSLGLRGLYTGASATLLRDVPFSLMFFPLSALFRRIGSEGLSNVMSGTTPSDVQKPSFLCVFLAGIGAGIIAAGSVTPADVIKTRIQLEARKPNPRYSGIADCFVQTLKTEGPRALMKGWLPRCAINAPLFGIAVSTYEIQQRWMARLHNESK
ncbi:mitochondrial carrier [Ramicandelaber brevisporus]|nr:mitochondrial carrier [Ramicandelaber brevisporus]